MCRTHFPSKVTFFLIMPRGRFNSIFASRALQGLCCVRGWASDFCAKTTQWRDLCHLREGPPSARPPHWLCRPLQLLLWGNFLNQVTAKWIQQKILHCVSHSLLVVLGHENRAYCAPGTKLDLHILSHLISNNPVREGPFGSLTSLNLLP